MGRTRGISKPQFPYAEGGQRELYARHPTPSPPPDRQCPNPSGKRKKRQKRAIATQARHGRKPGIIRSTCWDAGEGWGGGTGGSGAGQTGTSANNTDLLGRGDVSFLSISYSLPPPLSWSNLSSSLLLSLSRSSSPTLLSLFSVSAPLPYSLLPSLSLLLSPPLPFSSPCPAPLLSLSPPLLLSPTLLVVSPIAPRPPVMP